VITPTPNPGADSRSRTFVRNASPVAGPGMPKRAVTSPLPDPVIDDDSTPSWFRLDIEFPEFCAHHSVSDPSMRAHCGDAGRGTFPGHVVEDCETSMGRITDLRRVRHCYM
jgi:hypothetical protein